VFNNTFGGPKSPTAPPTVPPTVTATHRTLLEDLGGIDDPNAQSEVQDVMKTVV
jgi:hypothetical protein